MTNQFRSLITVAMLLSALIGLTGCGYQTGVPTNSNTTTAPTTRSCSALPKDIIDAIYNELEMSKSITREEWQWNIAISDPTGGRRTVVVTGWSANRDFILTTLGRVVPDCQLNASNFKLTRGDLPPDYRFPVGCNQGYKPCGDICIPNNEECKLTATASLRPAANVTSGSNSASNATPNSNSAPYNGNSNGGK